MYNALYAPVAQLDRALPSEGRGQRFESSRVRHLSPISLTVTLANLQARYKLVQKSQVPFGF